MECDAASVGVKRQQADFRLDHLQPVTMQLHVTQYIGAHRPAGVCQGGTAEAQRDLFRHSAAADYIAALQNERLMSRFGEIEGGHQAVVSAADDDHVALRAHVSRWPPL